MTRLRAFLRGVGRAGGINPTPVDSNPEAQVTRALDRPNLVVHADPAAWVGRLRSSDEELGEFFDRHREGRP